jgi:hypothetical protein
MQGQDEETTTATLTKKDTMEEEEVGASEAGQLLKIDAKGRPFDAALFGETVVRGFEKMYNNPALSDITLVVGDEKLPAHRMVLCAWSDTFRSMLENKDWAESSLHDLPIHLDDSDDQQHFKHMYHHLLPPFIYSLYLYIHILLIFL